MTDIKVRLAKWLYEHYGVAYHKKDGKQILWADIGYMVKDEYLKEAGEILDTFAFDDMYEASKAIKRNKLNKLLPFEQKQVDEAIAKIEGR